MHVESLCRGRDDLGRQAWRGNVGCPWSCAPLGLFLHPPLGVVSASAAGGCFCIRRWGRFCSAYAAGFVSALCVRGYFCVRCWGLFLLLCVTGDYFCFVLMVISACAAGGCFCSAVCAAGDCLCSVCAWLFLCAPLGVVSAPVRHWGLFLLCAHGYFCVHR